MVESELSESSQACCTTMFFAHYVDGRHPLVVLECCACGQLWHRRGDGRLVAYRDGLISVVE